MKKKGDISADTIGWWIIALVVLVVMLIFYMLLRSKGMEGLDFFRNLWRFGR